MEGILTFWIIALAWSILGTIIIWHLLSAKWAKLDRFFVHILDTLVALHPIPRFPNYMDLKFSAFRHAVVFLLSAAAIYWIDISWIQYAVLTINVIYAYLTIKRYTFRKRYVQETKSRENGEALADLIATPVNDSFCVVVFSAICTALLFILNAINI